MATTVTTYEQKIEVSPATDIVVTPIVEDGDTFVREFRIVGEIVGDAVSAPVSLVVRVRAPTRDAIEVTVPPSQM